MTQKKKEEKNEEKMEKTRVQRASAAGAPLARFSAPQACRKRVENWQKVGRRTVKTGKKSSI